MTERRVMKLASRGKRFGAACIDTFVPFVSYLLYSAVMAANGIKAYYPGNDFGNSFGYGYGYGYGYGFGYGNGFGNYHLSGASAAIMVVVFIILLAYIVAEFILFAGGKSIGKAILGLQVVSSNDGKPFRFWRMLFRECFVKSASGSILGLGYIWILIDEKNRGWHDKILDSYVVDLKESERMNYRRKLEMARAAAPKTESIQPSVPEPAASQDLAAREEEPEIMEIRPAEAAVEVIPETAVVTEEVTEENAETETEASDDEMTDIPYLPEAEATAEEKSAEETETATEEKSLKETEN